MVDNPTKIYNDYVRANLPNSMSYDTGTDRYDINSHSFFKFKNSNWYFNYISKYGYSALTAYAVNGFEPALVFDFKGNYFRKSATDSTFGASITHAATTNATMTDGYGPELVTNGKFGTDTAGWVSGSSAATSAAVSGEMQVTNVSSNGRVVTAIPTVVGRQYEVSGVGRVISGVGGPAASLYLTNSTGSTIQGGNINYTTTDAPLGLFFTATATTSYISAITFGNVGNVSAFDNVSVRQSPALKWRPHNLLRSSEDITNPSYYNLLDSRGDASQTFTQITDSTNPLGASSVTKISPNFVTDPQGANRFIRIYQNAGFTSGGEIITLSVFVKPVTTTSTYPSDITRDLFLFLTSDNPSQSMWVNLNTQAVSNSNVTYTSVGDGWYKATSRVIRNANDDSSTNCFIFLANRSNNSTFDPYPQADLDVRVTGFHAYKSSLGGMVNNPDTASSYVPTTTTPVYLSRRGHHIYNGSAWVNEGILHESEARTNILTSSGDLTGTGWTGSANIGTVIAGSPFGTYQTIYPASSGSLGGAQRVQVGKTLTFGATYVGWALVKYSAGSGWFDINMYDTGDTSKRAYFDVQNGVVGVKDAAIIDHGMVDYGDGWWLCWASANAASTSGGPLYEVPNGNGSQVGSTADVILIAGTQYELGSTPSSYIPTAGTTVTRAAETLTVPAANLPYPTPVEVTGTELVTNGDFSDGLTGWTQNANATGTSNVIGGQLVQTAPHGDYSETKQLNGSTVGKTYLCSFKVTAKVDSSTSVFINFGRTPVYSGPIANIPIGVFSGVVTSVHPDGFSISTRTNGQITIDNVSVKEVSYKLSIQMDGKMTYADKGVTVNVQPYRWRLTNSNYLDTRITTSGSRTGQPVFAQRDGTSGYDTSEGATNAYSPNTDVPFNLAGRYGSTFLNGAHEGTLLTANTTPTILPNLSSSDLNLGYIFMGTIGEFRMWSDDLGDVGITEATLPSTEPSLSLTFDGSENSFIVLDWSE